MKGTAKTGRQLPAACKTVRWDLSLFITDDTVRSANAVQNLKRICHDYLGDDWRVEIVDLLEHPEAAAPAQVVAVPTLVRPLPAHDVQIVGDLSSTKKVLEALEIR